MNAHRLIPRAAGTPRPRRAVNTKLFSMFRAHTLVIITVCYKGDVMNMSPLYINNRINEPRIIVARPRAVPIPRPRMAFGPTRLNLLTLSRSAINQHIRTHIGAFWSMSGTIKNLTILPLM